MSHTEEDENLVDYDEEEEVLSPLMEELSTEDEIPTETGTSAVRYSSDTASYDPESRLRGPSGNVELSPTNTAKLVEDLHIDMALQQYDKWLKETPFTEKKYHTIGVAKSVVPLLRCCFLLYVYSHSKSVITHPQCDTTPKVWYHTFTTPKVWYHTFTTPKV